MKSLAALTLQSAESIGFSADQPLRFWLRTGRAWVRQAAVYEAEGNDALAFVFNLKVALLSVRHLHTHPEYALRNSFYTTDIRAFELAARDSLDKLEALKPRLLALFDEGVVDEDEQDWGQDQDQGEDHDEYDGDHQVRPLPSIPSHQSLTDDVMLALTSPTESHSSHHRVNSNDTIYMFESKFQDLDRQVRDLDTIPLNIKEIQYKDSTGKISQAYQEIAQKMEQVAIADVQPTLKEQSDIPLNDEIPLARFARISNGGITSAQLSTCTGTSKSSLMTTPSLPPRPLGPAPPLPPKPLSSLSFLKSLEHKLSFPRSSISQTSSSASINQPSSTTGLATLSTQSTTSATNYFSTSQLQNHIQPQEHGRPTPYFCNPIRPQMHIEQTETFFPVQPSTQNPPHTTSPQFYQSQSQSQSAYFSQPPLYPQQQHHPQQHLHQSTQHPQQHPQQYSQQYSQLFIQQYHQPPQQYLQRAQYYSQQYPEQQRPYQVANGQQVSQQAYSHPIQNQLPVQNHPTMQLRPQVVTAGALESGLEREGSIKRLSGVMIASTFASKVRRRPTKVLPTPPQGDSGTKKNAKTVASADEKRKGFSSRQFPSSDSTQSLASPILCPVLPIRPTYKTAALENGVPLRPIHADANTRNGIETCAILAGKLSRDELWVTHLVVPRQHGTRDMCTTENEELLFEFQDSNDLMTFGWIHTHPTQTCFMSSVDLHTHCSYQLMLPEAIAIVCAPLHHNYGVFRLTSPPGLERILNCRDERTFHPHLNESSIYLDVSRNSHVDLFRTPTDRVKHFLQVMDFREYS